MSKSSPQTLVFIGDIHAGSRVGLWPLEELAAGKFIGVRYLMSRWHEFVKSMPKIDILFLNGDLIDGRQSKSDNVGIFTTDLGEQVDMATQVLKPLADKAKTIVRILGTPYHESHMKIFGAMDKELGIKTVEQVLDVDLGDRFLNIAHHPIGGTTIYTGTSLDREALWSQLAVAAGKVPDSYFIVRSHRHYYKEQKDALRHVIALPCWQLATAHAKKANYWRFQPDLGAVVMKADSSEWSGWRTAYYKVENPPVEVLSWKSL